MIGYGTIILVTTAGHPPQKAELACVRLAERLKPSSGLEPAQQDASLPGASESPQFRILIGYVVCGVEYMVCDIWNQKASKSTSEQS